MAVVQEAFYMSDDIAIGIATGLYKRIGGVIRYASGPNKGQIVKHLDSIDLETMERARGLSEKALQLVHIYKKQASVVAIGTLAISAGILGYNKLKNREPKALKTFRISLGKYIDAIRCGNMNIELIDNLYNSLEILKKHKDYDKILIKLSAEEIEVLVGCIYDYTVKLASDNSIDLFDDELDIESGVILSLESYLKAQKRIFKVAA